MEIRDKEKVERYANWIKSRRVEEDKIVRAFALWRIGDELCRYGKRKLALEVYEEAMRGYEELRAEKGNKLTLTPFPESGVETLTYEQAVDYLSKMIKELKQSEKS